ncbi:hypothetical protein N2152v2_007647 [Parachlorella kessleri]
MDPHDVEASTPKAVISNGAEVAAVPPAPHPKSPNASRLRTRSAASQQEELPGLVVTFEKLTYRVRNSRNKKQWVTLLDRVTAFLAPGEMTAILGPSGSGKTTLLDLLAGRKTVGELLPDSRILFGGRQPSKSFLRRHLGYVEQFDTLLPALTVHDMLLYTVQLKHPRTEPLATKQKVVETLIERLNLEECQHTVVGSVMSRGVSGGEAKRTNIGIALVTSPRVLFLDEPTRQVPDEPTPPVVQVMVHQRFSQSPEYQTKEPQFLVGCSGLDSFNAHSVITVVKDLVLDGITICSTIHSPPPYTFELFDRLLVLQRGRVAYFGPNGDAALDYFRATFPLLRGPSRMEGVADFVVDVTTQAAKQQAAGLEGGPRFAEAYQESGLREESERQLQDYLAATEGFSAAVEARITGKALNGGYSLPWLGRPEGTATPFWWALLTLWRYRSLTCFKQMDYLAPRMFSNVVLIFIMVTLFWKVGDELEPATITTVAAILYMWAIATAYTCMGIIPLLILERPAYIRERSDGLYRPITYLIFKFTEEVAVASTVSIPYSLLLFYLVRLQGSFLLVWLIYIVSLGIGIALALLAGALFSSVDAAGAALPAYITTLLYFAGFFIPWSQIPNPWKWYAVISYLRYSWGSLMVNQFEGPNNIVAFGNVRVLEYYSLEGVNKWAWIGYEAIFLVVFLLLTWLALITVRHQKR